MTLEEYNERMRKKIADKRKEIGIKMEILSEAWENFKIILKSKFRRKKDGDQGRIE